MDEVLLCIGRSKPPTVQKYGNARYDAAVSQYEATKAERDGVAAELRQRGIRKREFDRFIRALEKLPKTVTEFDEAMWGSLVSHVTVYGKDDLRFTLPCGTEIRSPF